MTGRNGNIVRADGMSTAGPLSDAEVKQHVADAMKAFEEMLEAAHSGDAEHAVQYTQARHWQIDRMFKYLLAEMAIAVHLGGNRRRELEARVRTLEEQLGIRPAKPPARGVMQGRREP
jgi:hypothetical protein